MSLNDEGSCKPYGSRNATQLVKFVSTKQERMGNIRNLRSTHPSTTTSSMKFMRRKTKLVKVSDAQFLGRISVAGKPGDVS